MFVGMPIPVAMLTVLVVTIYTYEQFGPVAAFFAAIFTVVWWVVLILVGASVRALLEEYGILSQEVTK